MQPVQPFRTSRRRRFRTWLLIIVAFCLSVAAGAFYATSVGLEDKPPGESDLLTAKNKSTIMLMGIDEREGDVGRSDTLMVATIDPKHDQAAILSIPRDTRVKIKGHGFDKINAAYAYGGEKLAERTVENFLGVNIDHYVLLNVHSFQKIIDAIGGIDVDVEKRMYYEDPWDDDGGLVIDLSPGMQHMDGKTAVTYVRYRDEEGDIGRVRRQQKFMKACMDKILSPAIIIHLPTIIAEAFDSVKTDLSVRQILELVGTLKDVQTNGLKTDMVPGKPLYIDGISYWIPDIANLRLALAETLGVTMNNKMLAHINQIEREYESSIPADATDIPSDSNEIGRADFSYSYTKDKKSSKSVEHKERTVKKSSNQRDGDRKKKEQPVITSRDEDTDLEQNSTADDEHLNDASDSNTVPDEEIKPRESHGAPSRDGDGGKTF